ncbi:MAG: hypothetical protein ACFE8L_12130, partial [Candidatus Hodarchaeota archaeon]
NIAEINSIKLFDYEDSLYNYFKDEDISDFCQRYFRWFEPTKFGKTNNPFLSDFKNYLKEKK